MVMCGFHELQKFKLSVSNTRVAIFRTAMAVQQSHNSHVLKRNFGNTKKIQSPGQGEKNKSNFEPRP